MKCSENNTDELHQRITPTSEKNIEAPSFFDSGFRWAAQLSRHPDIPRPDIRAIPIHQKSTVISESLIKKTTKKQSPAKTLMSTTLCNDKVPYISHPDIRAMPIHQKSAVN